MGSSGRWPGAAPTWAPASVGGGSAGGVGSGAAELADVEALVGALDVELFEVAVVVGAAVVVSEGDGVGVGVADGLSSGAVVGCSSWPSSGL